MPVEGTLEFWFSPDDNEKRPRNYLTVLSSDQEVLWFSTGDTLNVVWPAQTAGNFQSVCWCDPHANHVWINKGVWHHIAMEWDKEAVRLYIDGCLANMTTMQPMLFGKLLPSALKMGGTFAGNAWSGVVDEIRLSDVKRYGPVIPVGATWRPLPVVAAPPAESTKRLRRRRRTSPKSERRFWGRFRRRRRAQSRWTQRRSSRWCRMTRTSR